MAKKSTVFQCRECGFQSTKWMGRCSGCESWNSMDEIDVGVGKKRGKAKANRKASVETAAVAINQVGQGDWNRMPLGLGELDRVLGGGLVKGSLVLLGGDPGIGKSTLASSMAFRFADGKRKVLYVSGEESLQQTRMRAERIGCLDPNVLLLAEVDLDRVDDEVLTLQPEMLVVDSIQSVFCPELSSTPGTVSQLRESASRLMQIAKRREIPTLLIGHVTKDGAIAGPRVLEHMVDTVLYFEGERGHPYRILRAVKNRFGSTNEIGVFEMKEEGLVEVGNPSSLFLEQRPMDAAGSVVTVCMEGSRPLMVEVQALVGSASYGTPRRTCTGMDHNRVALLVAVLEKRGGLQLSQLDIFANVAGGFRLDEPAADLSIAMSLASSFRGRPVPHHMAMFGEIGLTGEIRAVSQCETRVREAMKLGFNQILLPANNQERLRHLDGVLLAGVRNVDEALDYLFRS
ncbi:MAG: DNA repair protein RadA [Deltaproteobacteria bacterium]|nr:MAG: DNA repair protein RadA [Deltaproteobacteria bacterium]